MLIDIHLPDALPERAVQIAREVAHGARVVLYSALEESEVRALVARSGADGFLPKSGSVTAIGSKLRALRAR